MERKPPKLEEKGETSLQDSQGFQFINQTESKIKDPAIKKLVRQNAISHVSKAREKERVRPIPLRAIVQGSIGEASGSDAGSDTIEDTHALTRHATQLDDYWSSKRGREFIVSSQPPTTAFSPTQLFARAGAESRTANSENLNQSPPNSITSPEASSSHSGHRDFTRGLAPVRQRRARFQRGCRTCRKRHLKCDEARPACLRCLRSYGSCEGYSNDGTGVHAFDSNIPTSSRTEESQLGFHRPSAAPDFSNETEALYFKLFLEETSLELTGVFDTTFWARIILQESHQTDFVRHALVGIAALSKSVKTKSLTEKLPEVFGTVWKEEATKQREYALKHFGKSLRGMQAIPWVGEDYLRKTTIAILLVNAFETIYGQPDLAFAHALICDRIVRRRIEIRDRARVRINGVLSPAPRVLDGDIFSAAVRFGLQLMTFVDPRPLLTHEVGRLNASDTMAKMPSEFLSLVEATYFWEYILRRSFHYKMWAAALSQANKLQRDFSKSFPGRILDVTPERCIYGSPYIVSSEIHTSKNYHIVEIGLWWEAFVPLLNQIQSSSPDLRERTAALVMHLYAIVVRIVVEGTMFISECSYDAFLPEFTEIVSLARQIDDNFRELSENQPWFHVHLNIVPPLLVTLLRCRDRGLRRQSIEILRSMEYDGPWNRWIVAEIGAWIMEVEEAGCDSDYIPEHARVQFSRALMGMENQEVMVQCVRRDLSLGWEAREPNLTWEEKTINCYWNKNLGGVGK